MYCHYGREQASVYSAGGVVNGAPVGLVNGTKRRDSVRS